MCGRSFRSRSAAAAAFVAVAAAAGAAAIAAPSATGAKAHPSGCSAASLPAGRAVPGLPHAVATMRLWIIAAARRCDYATLVRLGNERGRGFTFSYGATQTAPQFWRAGERSSVRPRPMEALVKLLSLPHAAVALNGRATTPQRARLYVWPSAHRERPTERDWRALRTLYTAAQIERMKRGGTGYLGYRVGITPQGDWQYFVAGD